MLSEERLEIIPSLPNSSDPCELRLLKQAKELGFFQILCDFVNWCSNCQ